MADDKRYALRALFKSVGLDVTVRKGYPDWIPAEDRRLGDDAETWWIQDHAGKLVGEGLTVEEARVLFDEYNAGRD